MNITSLLQRPEGKTLEFKRDLSSPERVVSTIIAFANTSGGTVLIGIDDATHDILGITHPHEEEEKLANIIADRISPRLVPEIEIVAYRGKSLLAVVVHPSSNRPYHIGDSTTSGTYVRVGSTNRQADVELVAEMARFARGESFDEQAMPDLGVASIDKQIFADSFADQRQVSERDLETLRLTTSHQGRCVPTVGGIVLFGAERLTHFPDAWFQVARFAGVNKEQIADHAEIVNPLPQALEDAYSFIERHVASGIEIQGLRGIPSWRVPPIAVREALINAVVHADYSQRGAPFRVAIFDDRIEIENPGLLVFGLTLEDLPSGVSKLRNKVIGRVFRELKLIEQWGTGVTRMIEACQRVGLEEPIWEEIATRIRVTLPMRPAGLPTADEVDDPIYKLLKVSDGLRTSEIAKELGLSTRATRIRLKQLIELGLLVRVGTGPTDPQSKYYTALH